MNNLNLKIAEYLQSQLKSFQRWEKNAKTVNEIKAATKCIDAIEMLIDEFDCHKTDLFLKFEKYPSFGISMEYTLMVQLYNKFYQEWQNNIKKIKI